MQLSQILLWCVSDGVPRRSFYVALIVGTILNLINQGDALFSGGDLNVTKIILTFVVPYCVATYGAVSYRIQVAQKPDRVKT
jgi:amino acid transporter